MSAPPQTREEGERRLSRRTAGRPVVAYRLEHGTVPAWVAEDTERWEQAERGAGEARGREAEVDPFPPRRPRGRHRASRWRSGWAVATLTYGTALAAGMVVSQVTALLM